MANSVKLERIVGKEHIDDNYKHADYSNHLDWYKEGHEQLLNSEGLGFQDLLDRHGLKTIARHIDVDYSGQLFEGDKVQIITQIGRLGNTSMVYEQRITKDSEVVSKGKLTVVFTDINDQPVRIPDEIRDKLAKYTKDGKSR